MHPGFKNVPDWEKFANLNRVMWQENNPGRDLLREDKIVKQINQHSREIGRGLNAKEILEIRENFY